MKLLRFLLPAVLLTVSTMAFAQADKQQSDAQKAFTALKTLAGTWEGTPTLDPPDPKMNDGKPMYVSLRVTSRGNALVHEMNEGTASSNSTDTDHPVTMFFVDGDHLVLTHYCDAGNRPRMTGTISPDGKKIEFNFLDLSGGNQHGHMYHAVFTIIDANHHTEDWTYLMPGDKPMVGHLDLRRVKQSAAR